MKFKRILLTLLLAIGLIGPGFAGAYDDWTDDVVCMWLDMRPTSAAYKAEVQKRGIGCEGGKAVLVVATAPAKTTASAKGTTPVNKTSLTISLEIKFYPVEFTAEVRKKLYESISGKLEYSSGDDVDTDNSYFRLGKSESTRQVDYVANSKEIFLAGSSSEKFSIQPLNCDLAKSIDCLHNRQELLMIEKIPLKTQVTKLYEWSMYIPEDHQFPRGAHIKYNILGMDGGDCEEPSPISFMEFDNGFRFGLSDSFHRDEVVIIKSNELTGKWHNFKLEVSWSRLPENGYIKLILNDVFVYEYKGKTMTCSEVSFMYGLIRAHIKKSNLVKSISNSVYFDNVKISNIDGSNPSIFLGATLGKSTKKIKANNIYDGQYTFRLYVRFEGEGNSKIGSGLFEIKNGNIIFINKKQSQLKTGSRDFYDTLEGQIDEDGQFYGSIELDILNGKDRSEVYTLKGPIKGKIWGDSPDECCAKIYFLPRLKK
jgi:hypothetical protein